MSYAQQPTSDGIVAATEVRSYACPVAEQAQTVARLREQFAAVGGFRVTADAATGQLLVIATPEVHTRIAQQLPSWVPYEPTAETTPRPWRETDGTGLRFRPSAEPAAAVPAPASTVDAQATTRFLLVRGDVARLQQRLEAVLGNRLRRFAQDGQTTYVVETGAGPVAELVFDARRGGVLATGRERVLQQLSLLLRVLETDDAASGRRTAVVSIERSDPAQLQQAIDAYRMTAPGKNDSSQMPRRPMDGGLALVNFMLQDAAAAGAEPAADTPATAPTDEDRTAASGELTPSGGLDVDVDVQTLPDLDVIILRGRDRDVQKLTEIIQELERLSRETQPQIRIYPLQFAQSEAVADILEKVSEDLTGRRQGRVSVTPLVKPNALLLIGWGDAIDAAIELIRKLDKTVAPETQFEVFRLRHGSSTSVATSITQFFTGRQGLGPKVQALADIRTNSVIVYAAPRDMAEVKRMVESLDAPGSDAVNQAKVVPLRNALAEDIAETLLQAIRATDATGGPSAILELLTVDERGKQIIRSGQLSNVRITANPRNNTLVISGPDESMNLLEELIRQLDVPGAVSQIKVFRIVNGDAASLVQTLRSLIPAQVGAGALGPQLPTAEGETSLAPLRFSVDTRTNSIIAAGSEGDLKIIEALLLRLDEKDLAERQNEVYRLRNAPALDVATAINEFLRSERIVQQAAPGSESPFEQIEREVVVVPEPVSNSLIISATPRYFEEIHKLVVDLDKQPPQVLIQVVIAEVLLDNVDEFGVELGLQDSVLFDRSLLGDLLTTVATAQQSTPAGVITATEEVIQAATNEPGFNFNNKPLGNSGSEKALANSGRVGGQGLSHFDIGRVNNELGFGGLVLSASSESVSVLIRALEESRRADVLSRPQVRTLDNQPAFIQVGERVPRIVASNLTVGGLQTNTIELENVGIILGVTPRISPDNTVVMEIDAEKSRLGPEERGIPITVSIDGTVVRSPSIETATAQATVSAASGETIILGGMITKRDETISRRVPYLADIPLLGDLFRFDSAMEQRAELLIILTPHVIRSPQDAQRLKEIELARMSWCAADVYELHGDVGTAYTSGVINDHGTAVIYPDLNPRGEAVPPPEPDPAIPPPANDQRDDLDQIEAPPTESDERRIDRQSPPISDRPIPATRDTKAASAPAPSAAQQSGRSSRPSWSSRLSSLLPGKSRKEEALE